MTGAHRRMGVTGLGLAPLLPDERRMNATPLTAEAVRTITRALLLREPYPAEFAAWCAMESEEALIALLRMAPEFRQGAGVMDVFTDQHLVFRGYAPEQLSLLREMVPDPPGPDAAEPGFIVDFLGCRTRVDYVGATAPLSGTVQGPPVPNDWHSDLAEWLPLLRAVRAAQGRFRILELGMGWAPWLVAGGALARRRGIGDVRLHGVEGDAQHLQWARTHLADNGFDPDAHDLRLGVVGTRNGSAYFTCAWGNPDDYGARPYAGGLRDYRGMDHGPVREVPMFALDALLTAEDAWDFVHMDVQGAEADLVESAADALNARAALVLVSTHSRPLDGRVMEAFWRAGWVLEGERPASMRFDPARPTLDGMTQHDGQQFWRNPRLLEQV